MRSHHGKSLPFCWTLVFIMTLTHFHELTQAQPQVYFKASQLPAKSLPRIGRRSDIDPYAGAAANTADLWNDIFSYDNNNNINSNSYNPRPESVLLWRKWLTGENIFPEDLSLPVGPNGLYKIKDKK